MTTKTGDLHADPSGENSITLTPVWGLQETAMFANKVVEPALVAVLALSLIGLAACDSGTEATAPAEGASALAGTAAETREARVQSQARRAVISDQLPYGEVEDELVYGHFAFPSDMIEPLPAVVMIHERWGLNDAARERADELAAEGYIVLAIDLFQGKTTTHPAEARDFIMAVIDNPDTAAGNIRSAVEFVSETAGAPSTAVLGWGFGGTWAVNAASLLPDEVDAAIVYYGQVTSDEARLQSVTAPILGLFGEKDRVVKLESINALRTSLDRLRKDYEIQVYPGAGSGFADPQSNRYDAAAADDAWRRTLEFLRVHLAGSDEAS